MLKIIITIAILAIGTAIAKPSAVSPVAYTAPLIETFETIPVHTSTSSQYFVRNYYGVGTSYVVKPAVTYAEPVVTYGAAPIKYTAYV